MSPPFLRSILLRFFLPSRQKGTLFYGVSIGRSALGCQMEKWAGEGEERTALGRLKIE
jgi:hypothetical protein